MNNSFVPHFPSLNPHHCLMVIDSYFSGKNQEELARKHNFSNANSYKVQLSKFLNGPLKAMLQRYLEQATFRLGVAC